MGPVFEEFPVLLDQFGEHLAPVVAIARVQDHVVRALDDIDRVDLHVGEKLYETQHIFLVDRRAGRPGESLSFQEQLAHLAIGN